MMTGEFWECKNIKPSSYKYVWPETRKEGQLGPEMSQLLRVHEK